MSYYSTVETCLNCWNYAYRGGYPCYQHSPSSSSSYYSSQPGSAPMMQNTSQDSNGSSNSSYSQHSSNTYASSPSTTGPYSPMSYQSGYSNSTITRTHYPPLAPSHPLPPAQPSKPPVSSSSEKKSKSQKPTPYICIYPACTRQFARSFDLDRHMKTHFPGAVEKIDCPKGAGSFCRRVGEKGFTRKDHLDEHLRKVHLVNLPKSARGTRQS